LHLDHQQNIPRKGNRKTGKPVVAKL